MCISASTCPAVPSVAIRNCAVTVKIELAPTKLVDATIGPNPCCSPTIPKNSTPSNDELLTSVSSSTFQVLGSVTLKSDESKIGPDRGDGNVSIVMSIRIVSGVPVALPCTDTFAFNNSGADIAG